MRLHPVILTLIIASISSCQSNERDSNDEFRIVSNQGLLHAPEANSVSLVKIGPADVSYGPLTWIENTGFRIVQRDTINAVPSSGVWQFPSPSNLEQLEQACYVATDGETLMPMRAGSASEPSSYAVSFSAVYPLAAAQNAERMLSNQKQELARTISTTNSNASSARQALDRDPLFDNGVCRKPDVALPTRPRKAISPSQARQIAERDIGICMRERVGCDVGADEFVRQTGLPRISGVPVGYVCGEYLQSGYCPADEWTGLTDAVQGMLFSSARDENLLAALLYGGTLIARYNEDLERLTQTYSRPYYAWQNSVRSAQNRAHNLYLSCQSRIDTIEAAPAIINRARNAKSQIDGYITIARKIASDNQGVIWKGETTECSKLACSKSGRYTVCGVSASQRR